MTEAGSPRRFAHSAALDGVRALAAGMVMLHHVGTVAGTTERWPVSGAWVRRMDSGVAIFFVLSGFLLYRPMLSRQLSGKTPVSLAGFWRSRFWRIFPAYWLALAILWWIESVAIFGADDFWHVVTLTQIYDPYWILTGIVQTWSLATEMSFYVVLPLLALAFARVARGRSVRDQARIVIALVVLLFAAAWGFHWAVETWAPELGGHTTWLPWYADTFALGMLLAALAAWAEHDPDVERVVHAVGRHGTAWVAAAFLSFWVVCTQVGLSTQAFVAQEFWRESTRHALYGLMGFLVVLPFALAPGPDVSLAHRAFGWKPVAWLGLVSYGVFLWHQMFLTGYWAVKNLPYRVNDLQFAGRLAWTAPLSILIAAASHYLFEKPLHDRFAKKRSPGAGDASRQESSTASPTETVPADAIVA